MRHAGSAVVFAFLCSLGCWSVQAGENVEAVNAAAIAQYRPVFEHCQAGERRVVAIRAYARAGVDFRLTVDPRSLQTRLEEAAGLQCDATPLKVEALLAKTPYSRALNAEREHENLVQDGGITHALRAANGYFLTADLCPSSKPGFNEQLFETLEQGREIHDNGPIPVALSVSGGWLQKHEAAFAWLRGEVAAGRLQVTWVNHTFSHPYRKQLDVNHNFMRQEGIDALAEVLGLEKILVEHGVAPSVFFRFPGLVSSPELIEMLERLHLVAVGSDAWLAKGEQPRPGSVILIHANLNEPAGVELLQKWIAGQPRRSVTFLPLESVAGPGN